MDKEGNTITYGRDTVNDTFAVSTITNRDGTESKITFDENYNELINTDELGSSYISKYDDNGNLTSSTDREGNVTTMIYNDKNLVVEEIEPEGLKTINQYSGYNLISVQVGEEIKKYEYDKYGRQTKETYPNNTSVIQSYDDANNKTTIKDVNGSYTTTVFNDFGQIIQEYDGENRSTGYKYDLLNPDIKTAVTDGNGNITTYEYDKNNNITGITNSNDKKKTYKYNGNDQLVESIYPVNGTLINKITNTYDENGKVETVKLNSGITKNYEYDETNQLISTIFKNKDGKDSLAINNTYDESGNLTVSTFKNVITNNNVIQKEFAYNANGLISNYNQGNYSTSYDYDSLDRINNEIFNYNDGVKAFKINQGTDYNEEGKISSVISSLNSNSLFKMVYSYDLKQNQITVNYNDGFLKNTLSFNNSSQVSAIQYTRQSNESTPLQSFTYEYDNSGNIIKEVNNNDSVSYVYDGNDQLIKEIFKDGTTNEYQYDRVGNRVKAIISGKETTYSYNEGNQVVNKNNSNSYIYDADGNVIKDELFSYQYNEMGSIIKVNNTSNQEVARYEYDESGLRTKKILGSKTFEYYYENNKLAIEVLRENNQVISYRYYQWDGNDETVSSMLVYNKKVDGTWEANDFYFLKNYRGDVISILDNRGNEVGSYKYDAFGNIISVKGTVAEENAIRYASYYYDSETKHYYLNARYYNPVDGVFLTIDSEAGNVFSSSTQHGYIYTENNPNYLIDPDGNRGVPRIYGGSKSKPKGIYVWPSFATGKAGEEYMEKLIPGKPQKPFETDLGGRIIDIYTNGAGNEIKVGYAYKTSTHKLQVRKDAWLIKDKQLKSSRWHFLRSKVTGRCGASKPLRDFIESHKKMDYEVYDY